jgi:hypothetical protein
MYGTKSVLHKIRVKLYPNYLPNGEAFLARTDSEAVINVEQVCAALRDRGGFTGNYHDLVEHIKQYYEEVGYQLCDGYTVSNGLYAIYPNLGGTFATVQETPDHRKHPLTFRFRPLRALRKLAGHIGISIDGEADIAGYIDSYTDTEEQSVNGIFIEGNMFVIQGSKIKIAGDHPDVGLYFNPVLDPERLQKVERISENNPSKITGIAISTGYEENRLVIKTQFASGNTLLKEPRTITSKFFIEQA